METIIWGSQLPGLEKVLDQVRSIGFEGVEFGQAPSLLGPPDRLAALLAERELAFLGLATGLVENRIDYCRKLRVGPVYIYMEDWNDDIRRIAQDSEFAFALHPRQFQPIDRFGLAQPVLRANPDLMFVPDTGHLWLAGDDLLQVLEKTKDRLVAVHLKDWRPDYGFSFAGFSRGFTELGQGIVPLEPVWGWLKENYDGWVVVEQNHTDRPVADSLRISWDWLHGERRRRAPRSGRTRELRPGKPTEPLGALRRHAEQVVAVLDVIARDSPRDIEQLYASVLGCLGALVECRYASLWEVSPRVDRMNLQASWPTDPPAAPTVSVLSPRTSVSGQAAAERKVMVFEDLPALGEQGRFQDAQLAQRLGLETIVSVPVLNTFNSAQTELVINLFPKAWPIGFDVDVLAALAQHVALAVERAWNQMREQIADEVSYTAGVCAGSAELLEAVLERVRIYTRSMAASILLVNASGTALEISATTGLVGGADPDDIAYEKSDGLPGTVWETNQVIISHDAASAEAGDPRPLEHVPTPAQTLCVMPIRGWGGEVIGVLRCRGKVDRAAGESCLFSVTDEMALDAITRALSPHLARMLAGERRTRAMGRMTHELKMPIGITKGALDCARAEMRRHGWSFSEDFLGDIEGYMDLMGQVVGRVGFLRPGAQMRLDRSSRVFVLKDVVAPAVRQIRMRLQERGFSQDAIERAGVKELPPMYLDKARFQQVIFNLLDNAIKYAFDDPAAFAVEITGRHTGGGCRLMFRDWGPGIDEGAEESCFLEGVRGRTAHQMHVAGDGIGLWVVRQIVTAHGGEVTVTSLRNPTEFTIVLPSDLQRPTLLQETR